jgi:glycosyltransferase A (GT-A) superfamily protein (DUF2064 family)
MMPITVQVPAQQCEAIAAEVQRTGGFDGDQRTEVMRVWLGPSLELVLDLAAADRLADALVDAIAEDDEQRPVLFPAAVKGW